MISRESRHGGTLIEVALGTALLLPVFVGATQYLASLYVLYELHAAVEQGAEAGCALSPDDPRDMEQKVREAVVRRGAVARLRVDQVDVRIAGEPGERPELVISVRDYALPTPWQPTKLTRHPEVRFPLCVK
jgi:hypothetical protein